ncbi:hypothetical protein PP460_gp139 [Streptomyces phage Muntaha]|uniref:Uncharacterized protein n=1 Tax=Streptomyces phage Muntaha TaxID=2713269 RepID=A0A6G8R3B1_9CAUD|nr:hypothetical protein PP460_gp139 [Streptomyces phage Muntaha]QIN94663.1 hypothetical protein SEA_MUNTAHA_132 [Streptomyces phage Muntaha]
MVKFVKVEDEVVSVEISLSDVGAIGSGLARGPQTDREESLARIFRSAHERLTASEDEVAEDATV